MFFTNCPLIFVKVYKNNIILLFIQKSANLSWISGGTEGSWTPVWKSSYDTFYTLIEHILVPDVLYSRKNTLASLCYCQALKAYALDPVPLIDAVSQAVESWGDRLAPIRQQKPILCYYLRLNLISVVTKTSLRRAYAIPTSPSNPVQPHIIVALL